MLLKIAGLFIKKPLGLINAFLSGKKTHIAGSIIILQALACMLTALSSGEVSLDKVLLLLNGDCMKQLGEGLAIIGFRAAMGKMANGNPS